MRKLIYCLIAIGILVLSSVHKINAQSDANSWIRTGTTMSYMVNYDAKNYDFIVGMLSFYPEMKFTWEMNYPIRNKGLVEISQDAMDNATEQVNYFSGGNDYLDDKTTVWVSYAVYNALKNKEPVTIKAEEQEEELTYIKDYLYETVINDSTVYLKSLYAESDLGNKFWILDDPVNPIILKMVLTWSIEIGFIQTKEYFEE